MKIMFIAPHLSTGGLPQYLYKKIKELKEGNVVYVVEYESNSGNIFNVQKNKLKELLGASLFSVGDNKKDIIDIIQMISPDVIHFEEMPEYFMDYNITARIYRKDRKYKIVETSHDSSFDVENKRHFPDKFVMVSEYQRKRIAPLDIPTVVVEYPIEYKERPLRAEALADLGLDPEYQHVINIGLFTPRKNQAEIFEYAKLMKDEKIKFHFIGNCADNFGFYWKPLIHNKPENCIVWGERSDVEKFYAAADLFLFTSRGTDNNKETSPLVIREAIGWKIPSLIYNLDVYEGMYDSYGTIGYLSQDINKNVELIKQGLNIKKKLDNETLLIVSTYPNSKSKVELTTKCLSSAKSTGFDTMLTGHCDLKAFDGMCDFIVVDDNNILTYNSYYTNCWGTIDKYKYQLGISKYGNNMYHGAAVYTNYYNGIVAAKNLGYKQAVCFNFDMEITNENFIKSLVSQIGNKKGLFAQFESQEGPTLKTVFFVIDVDFFLEHFPKIENADDYEKWWKDSGANSNGLENIFHHTLESHFDNFIMQTSEEFDNMMRTNTEYDICSAPEYFTILPVKDDPIHFYPFFLSFNELDSREVTLMCDIITTRNNIEEYSETKTFNGRDVIALKIPKRLDVSYHIKLRVKDEVSENYREFFVTNDTLEKDLSENGKLEILY